MSMAGRSGTGGDADMGTWVGLTTVDDRERPRAANELAFGEYHRPRPPTERGMTATCRWGISVGAAHFVAFGQMPTMSSSSIRRNAVEGWMRVRLTTTTPAPWRLAIDSSTH